MSDVNYTRTGNNTDSDACDLVTELNNSSASFEIQLLKYTVRILAERNKETNYNTVFAMLTNGSNNFIVYLRQGVWTCVLPDDVLFHQNPNGSLQKGVMYVYEATKLIKKHSSDSTKQQPKQPVEYDDDDEDTIEKEEENDNYDSEQTSWSEPLVAGGGLNLNATESTVTRIYVHERKKPTYQDIPNEDEKDPDSVSFTRTHIALIIFFSITTLITVVAVTLYFKRPWKSSHEQYTEVAMH